ncbi:monoheme cytochrome C [Muricauda sp. DJ-13]|uniref:Monoheme cytochrome C n=1 Tax=Croceivirga thetidis TaxID=2721623 RepID=A0ABX1GP82_9FLAO|nr:monoheme cytochrome C [Croceivirga thetidis]
MEYNFRKQIQSLGKLLLVFGLLFVVLIFGLFYLKNNPQVFEDEVEDSALEIISAAALDEETIANSGFINDEGVTQVIQNCTQCHSSKLVTQNRMSAEGWKSTILWMQETQNLWDLGTNEELIVAYLAKNYAPERKGRRENLTNLEWYEIVE